MKKLYLVGGRQRTDATRLEEWRQFDAAVVAEVDLEAGSVSIPLTYESPQEVCPDEDPCYVFKAASLVDQLLFTCTQTEVLVYAVPDFKLVRYVSLPCFNDLHHVRPCGDDGLRVVSTGLDMVVEVDRSGRRVREWSALGEDPWERFSPDVDYRKVPTTKPHRSHPNYTFEVGSQVWVTRFEQRDAVQLGDSSQRIPIDIERPHDGIVHEDAIYFTTVDGHIIVVDTGSLDVRRVIDLNAFSPENVLGWCRGISILDADRLLVCFSRIRPTRLKENVQWVARKMAHAAGLRAPPKTATVMPTHIALYDIHRGERLWEMPVEDSGINVIFSVHVID